MEARDVIKSVENIYPISESVLDFLLNHIGNPDPKIRDEVVYGAWYKLIKEHKLMQSQKLNILQRVLRDRFLLHGLGTTNENYTVSVFLSKDTGKLDGHVGSWSKDLVRLVKVK